MPFAKSLRVVFALSLFALPFSASLSTDEESALPPGLEESQGEPPWRMRVEVDGDPAPLVRELRQGGMDIDYVDRDAGVFEPLGGIDTYLELRRRHLAPQIVESLAPTTTGVDALSDYLDPAEVAAELQTLESTYPDLALRFQLATTHEGRIEWALKVSDNVATEEDEPAILFVAQHHAREVMTPEVVLDVAQHLLAEYGSDPEITAWVDDYEIWVIPNHNPDGSQHVHSGTPLWRKNRRDNGDGTIGVDPNRNYSFQWGNSVCNGSDSNGGSDTYHGPSPESEPITQGITALAREHRPAYNVSFHAYGEYVIHPMGCTGQYADSPDYQTFRELASDVAVAMPGDTADTWYRPGSGPELLYDVDGEQNDWFYGELGSFGVTFEVNRNSEGFQPDYDTWRDKTVVKARGGWKYFLRRLSGPHVSGHIYDACDGSPLQATIKLASWGQTHSEDPRTSHPTSGRFDWPVLPGSYTLEISNPTYYAQEWPVDVDFSPKGPISQLVPDGSFGAAVSDLRVDDSGGDLDTVLDPGETADLFIEAYATGGSLSNLSVTVSTADPYVTLLDTDATFAPLASGTRLESTDAVRVAIAPDAPDGHVARLDLTFSADETLCAATTGYDVGITRGMPAAPFLREDLVQDPGWEIDNGGVSGGWEFGEPTAAEGPGTAYTGSNVYGTNLGGDYGPGGNFRLTAGPYDLSTLRHTELRYARWLQNQAGRDIARIEIRIGVDGPWQEVWSGFGRDQAWVPLRYDVSSMADLEDAVYVRFSLQSDASIQGVGFYLDDLSFVGEEVPGAGGKVKYKSHVIDDGNPAYGNGNGRLDVGETATIILDVVNTTDSEATAVTGILSSQTPGITIHDDVASWNDIPSGGLSTSLAPHFTISAAEGCGGEAQLLLTTRWSDGRRAESTFTMTIGQVSEVDILADDFENPGAWTTGGDALAGHFVREDPFGVSDPGVGAVQPEDDNTDFPGLNAWISENPQPGAGFSPEDGDIDRGTVYLESPTFDGSGAGSLLMTFARWFHRTNVSALNEGSYRARVSSDDGTTWIDLETLTTNASAWQVVLFDLGALINRTSTMRVRFEGSETIRQPGDPLVEVLIDDVRIYTRSETCDPFDSPDTLPPNAVGNTLFVEKRSGDVVLSWQTPPTDAEHDPARFYPTYRSGTPSGGFTLEGEPTTATWHDSDAGGPSGGNGFYLVSAKNAAGTSGEEPAP